MERYDEEQEQLHGHDLRTKIVLKPQEGGPLGLKLRKSESLASIIDTILTQENRKRESASRKSCSEKLKASHIPVVSLQIGSWKWESTREGDLVAKIYYAKKKLVWEFLYGSIKRKIEISWSEISAINTFNGHLEIELNEPPQFGQEINSQPRKHTQWTSMNDFTGEQALIYRRHKIEFIPGVLDKHFEKLLQCDNRLLHLSRQPFPIHNSPVFPNICLNFSHNQDFDIGCSSVLVPPTDTFSGYSSSRFPSSALDPMVSWKNKETGDVWEQSEMLQIDQETSFIPIEQQLYHRPESMILDPQMELLLNDDRNFVEICKDSNCIPFNQHQVEENYNQVNGMNQFGYINNRDDTNYGGSVTSYMEYDGICNVYQPCVNGGIVMDQEPNSYLADQVDTNCQEHMLLLDQKWRIMEDGDQNYRP